MMIFEPIKVLIQVETRDVSCPHTRFVMFVPANSASGRMPSELSLIKNKSDLLAATLQESQYLLLSPKKKKTMKQTTASTGNKRQYTNKRADASD